MLQDELRQIAHDVEMMRTGRDAVFDKLKEIAEGLNEAFTSDLRFSVRYGPLLSNLRLVVERKEIEWEDTLLQAHVAEDGFPVLLRTFVDRPETKCTNVDELENAVVNYLREPINVAEFRALRRAGKKK